MKYGKYIVLLLIVTYVIKFFADCPMPAYQNTITNLCEIHDELGTRLVMHCESHMPIVVYSPRSFQEFTQQNYACYYMPSTILFDNVDRASLDRFKVIADEYGVAIQIDGAVRKIVQPGCIIFETTA